MKIEKFSFGDLTLPTNRNYAISAAILKMGVDIPHIVMTLVMLIETSPKHGQLDLFDVGFHAHWQDNGRFMIDIELTLSEDE